MSPRSKQWFAFGGLIVAHYLLTLGCLLLTFGASMDRFDTGRQAGVLELIASGLLAVLSFPVIPILKLLPIPLPGLWGHLPFLLNSTLWAFLTLAVIARLRRQASTTEIEEA